MQTASQVDKLYKALKAGRKLSSLDVFRLTGSLSCHKRARECESKYGVKIKRIPFKHEGLTMRKFSL